MLAAERLRSLETILSRLAKQAGDISIDDVTIRVTGTEIRQMQSHVTALQSLLTTEDQNQ